MMKPLYDKILIEPLPKEVFTYEGMELSPSSNNELPRIGRVVAVGNGILSYGNLIPLTCKVGDKVIYPNAGGKIIYSDNKQLVMIRETDVFGVED